MQFNNANVKLRLAPTARVYAIVHCVAQGHTFVCVTVQVLGYYSVNGVQVPESQTPVWS